MPMTLYWGSGSPFAWRAMLALAHKGLPYEGRLLSFSAREHKAPDFLALNPRGKVPVLVDGDVVVRESTAILRHLDRVAPEPSLFGGTRAEQADIDRLVAEAEAYGWPIGRRIVQPLFFGKSAERADDLAAALPEFHQELGWLQDAIGDGDTLVGDRITAADLCWYPLIRSLVRAASKPEADAFSLGVLPLDTHWPALARWMRRVEAIDGFARTWPPHWGPFDPA